MPNHWTYSEFDPGTDLYQGDIIARTDPLLKVLEEVHQHFCDEKYLAFLVISQTCDLVLRKQKECKARHINLAVVRALEDIVPELFSEVSRTGIDGVYRQEEKGGAREQMERILNQNEQAQGIFYLYPDADVRIAVHAVSLLRVSIALRAREHYELVQKARCGRLATEYRYKLGWLTGNLFSRVDTPDWSDHDEGPSTSKDIIDGFVDGSKLPKPNVWVPDSWIQAARKKNVKIEDLPREQVFETLKAHAPLPRIEVATGRIREIGARVQTLLGEDQLQELTARLDGDDIFSLMIADASAAVIRGSLPEVPALDLIRNDTAAKSSFTGPVSNAIIVFQKHRGPRELVIFLDYYASASLLSDTAIARIRQLISKFDNTIAHEHLDEIEAELRTAKPSGLIVGYIRSLASEAIGNSFIERLVTRLENDQTLKTALK